MPKLNRLRGNLPVSGVADNQRTLIGIFQHVEDEAHLLMCLCDRCNEGNLEIVPKHLHHILCGKDNNKATPHTLLHLPADEGCHRRCACQHIGFFFDGVIQGLTRPGRYRVKRNALHYIIP